jgi:tRNA modification GTPase
MHDLNDTIVAVSSPTGGTRAIVRITGPRTVDVCEQAFWPPIKGQRNALASGKILVDDQLKIDAQLYLFLAPHSYTGEDVAEIHVYANSAVTEAVIGGFLRSGLRMAGPGEFTARAYLNGKIDLAQAEAVNEVVTTSNAFQLAAAEKLLGGRLAETTARLQSTILDCLSLIEAGLDFSSQDIEFIAPIEAVERLSGIRAELEQLLAGTITYESVIDLPSVGIAGAPNTGKSSLLNKLLGEPRSIVSHRKKTTRDVLTGLLTLAHCRCVLFDCAGLTFESSLVARLADETRSILDELAQQAAIDALRNSSLIVFCIDISKANWAQDIKAWKNLESEIPNLSDACPPGRDSQDLKSAIIPVATKSDLVPRQLLSTRLAKLNNNFKFQIPNFKFPIVTSMKTGVGLEQLRETIDRKLLQHSGLVAGDSWFDTQPQLLLSTRHKKIIAEAIVDINEASKEIEANNEEVAAMLLRTVYQGICGLQRQQVDEQILGQIFSRFCIGK